VRNQLTIDLQPFCEVDSVRYSIDKPFVINGYRYATDSRVLVRVPCDEPDSVTPLPVPRSAGELFAKFPGERARWRPWPEPEYLSGKIECPTCSGRGLVECRRCDACSGKGEIECRECGQSKECAACGGYGEIGLRCKTCHGAGEFVGPKYQPIGSLIIDARLDRNIRDLLNVQFVLQRYENNPICFKFDGGQGLVMPMLKENLTDLQRTEGAEA
jgi:transcription elongation factor Elf1